MTSYIVTVSSDQGLYRIRTSATSAEVARHLVIVAERCPAHAIITVREEVAS